MIKVIFVFIFFAIIGNDISHAQVDRKIWVIGNVGIGHLKSDIGYNRVVQDPGISCGLQIVKRFDFGMNAGIGYQFSSIKKDDNGARGYEIKTKLNELEILCEYNLIQLFSENISYLKMDIGFTTSYYISKNLLNISVIDNRYELFKDLNIGFLYYPTLKITYNFGNFQIGVKNKMGFSSNDYLEGFTTIFSNNNDKILSILLIFGYKIR